MPSIEVLLDTQYSLFFRLVRTQINQPFSDAGAGHSHLFM